MEKLLEKIAKYANKEEVNMIEKGTQKMVERACDVCSELFLQGKYSDIAGKNGQWIKVFLCPKHKGETRK